MPNPAHLLIVDDELNVTLTLRRVLEREGYRVSAATTATEAYGLISADGFEVAVIDLRLGDAEGIDVLRSLRAQQPYCVAVILTGYASIESAVAAIQEGAYAYLIKPCDLDELKLTVKGAVERSTTARYLWENLQTPAGVNREEGASVQRLLPDMSLANVLNLAAEILQRQRAKNGGGLGGNAQDVLTENASAELQGLAMGSTQPEQDLLGYLRQSKAQLSAILSGIAEGILVQDVTGKLVYANEAVAHILGYPSPQALVDAPPDRILRRVQVKGKSGKPFPVDQLPWHLALEGRQGPSVALGFLSQATGDERAAIVKATTVLDDDGQPQFAVSIFTDITEQVRVERELEEQHQIARQRQQRLQVMAEGLLSIGLLPISGSVEGVTEVVRKATGVHDIAFCQYNNASQQFTLATKDPTPSLQKLAALGLMEKAKAIEVVGSTGQSAYIPDCSADPVWSEWTPEVQAIYAVAIAFRDRLFGVLLLLSDQANGIHPEERFMADTVSAYAGAVLENARLYEQVQTLAIEKERRRISQEMHDGLAQVLSYVNTTAQAVELMLGAGNVEEATQQVQGLSKAAREAYRDVLEGMLALRSQIGPGRTLQSALEEYLKHYERQWGGSAKLQWQTQRPDSGLSPIQEVQVLRIVQEALTNVRKHAHATEVKVRLASKEDGLEIAVLDNGVGLDPMKGDRGGLPRFGLQIMQERALSIGGRLKVERSKGRGTAVRLWLPL